MKMQNFKQLLYVGLLMVVMYGVSPSTTSHSQDGSAIIPSNADDIVPLMTFSTISADATLAIDEANNLYAFDAAQSKIVAWELETGSASDTSYSIPSSMPEWQVLASEISPEILRALHPDIAVSDAGVLAWATDGKLQIQNADEAYELISPSGQLTMPMFSALGDALFAIDPVSSAVMVWDSGAASSRWHVLAGTNPAAISPNSDWLAVTYPFNVIEVHRVRDVINDRASIPYARLDAHLDTITALAFSNDSRLLVSGSADASISVWDLETQRQVIVLNGHTGPVNQLQLTADGALLFSASQLDSTIRLWNPQTGRLLYTIEGVRGAFALSPDEQYLAGVYGEEVVVWGIGNAIALDAPIMPTIAPTLTAGIRGMANRGQQFFNCALNRGEWVLGLALYPDGSVLAYVPACEEPVRLTWDLRVQWEGDITTLPPVPPRHDPVLRMANYNEFCADVPAITGNNVVSRLPFAYPPDLLPSSAQATLSDGQIGSVICFSYPTVVIENCHNIGPGNYSYIYILHRVDTVVSVLDYENGNVVAQARFEGAPPPPCPTEAIRGDGFGETAPVSEWLPYLYGIFYGVERDALTRTVASRDTAGYAAPSASAYFVATMAADVPITPVARSADGRWIAVLTWEMKVVWVSAADLWVAVQRDLSALPESDANIDNFLIEVNQ